MDKITHDWKCAACGHWSPDAQTQTRCASCRAPRPDIAEYRKRRSAKAPGPDAPYSARVKLQDLDSFLRKIATAVKPAEPGDIVWVCERCSAEHSTKAPFCPDCGGTRNVNGEIKVKAPLRWPRAGLVVGIVGSALLWWAAGGWAALGAFLIVWGDNLGRGR